MLEKLKELLGEAFNEDVSEKVAELLKTDYVTKADNDTQLATLADAQAQLKTAAEKIASMEFSIKVDGSADLVKAGANANELVIPKLTMQGLGEYNRNDGYVNGEVTLTAKTVACNACLGYSLEFQLQNPCNDLNCRFFLALCATLIMSFWVTVFNFRQPAFILLG